MITTQIEVSTRKGHSQVIKWAITQDRPYPDLEKSGRALSWRNTEELLGERGNPPAGLGRDYTCNLLRDDEPVTDIESRVSFAGYDGNPGSITLRGVEVGEIQVQINENPASHRIRVRGWDRPSDGERKFIVDRIVPGLIACIEANRDKLKEEAIAGLRENMQKHMQAIKDETAQAEAEMFRAIETAAHMEA